MSSNKDYEFNEKIHSILLNPYLTKESFENNINLIKKYNIKNISTSLNFLPYIKDIFPLSNIKINTLISYPFGDLPNNLVKELILYAKDSGSEAIEYTPKFFTLSNKNDEEFAKDIETISNLDLPITLIFNKRKLSKEILTKAINISSLSSLLLKIKVIGKPDFVIFSMSSANSSSLLFDKEKNFGVYSIASDPESFA